MRRAFIFANGQMDGYPAILKGLDPSDLIIAADGGTHHCATFEITPSVIIGDFDSLQPQELETYRQAGVELIQYPSQKNETDLELALQYVVQKNAQQAYIFGALGARWDMTLSNVLLLAQPSFSKLQISLMDGRQEFLRLRGGEQADIPGHPGDPISLIPLAGDAQGITTEGLEYPLDNETLYLGSSRGVSNVFVHDHALIKINKGVLVCVFYRVDTE